MPHDFSTFLTLFLTLEFAFAFGIAATIFANRTVSQPTRKQRWKKLIVYVALVHAFLAISLFGYLPWAMIPVSALCVVEWFWAARKRKNSLSPVLFLSSTGIFLTLVFFAQVSWWTSSPENVTYYYFLVIILDSYSQLTGQLLGKNKLAPLISPNKTWEGLIGGTCATILAAFFLNNLCFQNWFSILSSGIFVALCGTLGDLSGSGFKRKLGIKDYSNWLPGQGGWLDRFNSTISVFAALWFLSIFKGG